MQDRSSAICDVLAACGRVDVRAAVHLALPKGQLVGIHATFDDTYVRWRRFRRIITGDASRIAHVACELVASDWRDGDMPRDLTSPSGWFEAVRTGSRIIVWGSTLLTGVEVSGDLGCDPDALVEIAAGLCGPQRGEVLAGGVWQTAAGTMLLTADNRFVSAVSTSEVRS